MENFKFYQDVKVELWKRQSFSIQADTEEEAIRLAEQFKTEDVTADIDDVDTEELYETEQLISSSENNGQNTIELFLRNGKRLIGGNGATK